MISKNIISTVVLIAVLVMLGSCSEDITEPAAEDIPVTYISVPDDYPTIREATAAASPGDTIFVRAGTYIENDISLKKGCCLFGDENDSTIIDARTLDDSNRDAILRLTDESDHNGSTIVRNIHFVNQRRSVAVFVSPVGVVIQACSFFESGGGIVFAGTNNGSNSIISCTFENIGIGQSDDAVGAIYIDQNAVVSYEILQCDFRNNLSGRSSGVVYGNTAGTVFFRDCNFSGNESPDGGTLYFREMEYLSVSHCVFEDNVGEQGGALHLRWLREFYVRDSVFRRNAANEGGAIFAKLCSTGELTRNEFTANRATYGGAVDVQHGTYTISECFFIENGSEILDVGNRGAGGGVAVGYSGALRVVDCTFFGNWAFGNNDYLDGNGACISLDTYTSSAMIESSILSFSSLGVPVDGRGVLWWVQDSDVYGNEDGDWASLLGEYEGVEENLSVDPMFCSPEEGDFGLQLESPLIGFSGSVFAGAGSAGCSGKMGK